MSNFQSIRTDGSESLFGEVIFSYIRAQAIADCALIDVTPTAVEAGFRFPTSATDNLMAAIDTIRRNTPMRTCKAAYGTLCRARHKEHALDGLPFRSKSEARMLSNCL